MNALELAEELELPYWNDGTQHGQLVKAASMLRRQHEAIESLKRENEANERNLCTLTDDLAASRKEVAQLHEAIQKLREACQKVVVAFDALPRDNEARYSNLQINAARIALKDTEGLV